MRTRRRNPIPAKDATARDRKKSALPGGTALDLERRLSYRFSILSTRVIRSVASMYGPKYGILPSGWKAMTAIGRYGPVSAKEVCSHTTVEPDKVTRAVDRLAALGFVRREQDPADRRRVALSLSPAGRKVYEDIERLTRQVELTLLEALSMREREILDRILAKLEGRAGKCIGDRQAVNAAAQTAAGTSRFQRSEGE